MKEIEVRPATAADIPALARMMSELGYPTSTEAMAKRMEVIGDRRDYAAFVAGVGGAVAGMIGASVSPSFVRSDPHGGIIALVVLPEFRGKGIGERLVRRAEQWLRENGAIRVTLNSGSHRSDAHRFYRRLGYEHTGLRFVRMLSE